MPRVVVLPGDGIGPEVVEQAVKVLNVVADKFCIDFEFEKASIGYSAYLKKGSCLPQETLEACKNSDAILLGAVGDPRAEKLPPSEQPERGALLPLRKEFELFANIRPARVFPGLVDASPLKSEIVGNGFEIVVVRELTGGIYFGEKKEDPTGFWKSDLMKYSKAEVERVATKAFEIAESRERKKLTSVDKANVLYTSLLWRQVVEEVHKKFKSVELEHLFVDNAAMQLIKNPKQFDVILTSNLFGDILSDECSMLTGSLGMLPSASLGSTGFGLYEPIHGSAPKYAGLNVVNPIATILSAGMMLDYSFGLKNASKCVSTAVERVIQFFRTKDIFVEGKKLVGTSEMGDLIAKEVNAI